MRVEPRHHACNDVIVRYSHLVKVARLAPKNVFDHPIEDLKPFYIMEVKNGI
jgi:hypothetical protein